MKAFLALAALTVFLTGGCASTPSADDSCAHATYDGKTGMTPYVDAAHGFRICVPRGLTCKGPDATTQGRVFFTGFAVPAGTNLESKTLTIVFGKYDELDGLTTKTGEFMAGGVTFKRVEAMEGSLGHSDLHVIYTWKMNGRTPVHFDFNHHSVNPGVFDPGKRPAEYDSDAQIRLTEEIMRTFVRI